jgi:RNA polymerase sigma-70 factor, ECF subfamily
MGRDQAWVQHDALPQTSDRLSMFQGSSMSPNTYAESELKVRTLLDTQEHRQAATQALDSHGPEVLRFLSARLGDRAQAEEAYLQFSEDLWVGLPVFRWESTLRTWVFILARNAAMRVSRKRQREGERPRTPPRPRPRPRYEALREHVRTTTARYLRTAVKDRMRAIRQRLDEDEQTLLILRVDRKLEWNELAVVMNEAATDAPEPDMQRAAARLRERFQIARARLRALAESEGLLRRKSDPA